MKNQNKWICIWLAVIAFLLLAGVVLFAAYVYKFDPLTPFIEIFSFKGDVFWSAANAIAIGSVQPSAGISSYFKILT